MAQWPLAEAAFGAHLMEPRVSGRTLVSSRLVSARLVSGQHASDTDEDGDAWFTPLNPQTAAAKMLHLREGTAGTQQGNIYVRCQFSTSE